MRVVTIDLPELGNRCHLVHDGSSAARRGPAARPGAGRAGGRRGGGRRWWRWPTPTSTTTTSPGPWRSPAGTAPTTCSSADEPVDFERVGVRDGDLLGIGALDVRGDRDARTHPTPPVLPRGSRDPADGHPGALFSGGSLLHGTVGRTDLLGAPLTRDLARAQWASARSLGALDAEVRLPPHARVRQLLREQHRRHGRTTTPPSATSARPTRRSCSTRDQFVDELVAGFGPVPAYYDHMGAAQPGRRRPAGHPSRPSRSRRATSATRWTTAPGWWTCAAAGRYAEGHLAGTVSVEYCHQFATYVGWLVPWYGRAGPAHRPPGRRSARRSETWRGSASTASAPTCSTPPGR